MALLARRWCCCRSTCRSSTSSRSSASSATATGSASPPRPSIFAIAALGLNLLTGVAGQVSLGPRVLHGRRRLRCCVPRRRGGLGHVGPRPADLDLAAGRRDHRRADRAHHRARRRPSARPLPRHRHRRAWCSSASTCPGCCRRSPGQPEVGRNFPPLEFTWWKEEQPVISFNTDGHWLWFDITGNQKTYLFCLALLGDRRAGRQEPRSGPAPAAPCRRSATATSPPR